MITSYYRGHKIFFDKGQWYYKDTKELVSKNKNRFCGYCQKENTKEGHDGCIGELPDVVNACCGHGRIKEAYIQLNDGSYIRGSAALYYMIQELCKLKVIGG